MFECAICFFGGWGSNWVLWLEARKQSKCPKLNWADLEWYINWAHYTHMGCSWHHHWSWVLTCVPTVYVIIPILRDHCFLILRFLSNLKSSTRGTWFIHSFKITEALWVIIFQTWKLIRSCFVLKKHFATVLICIYNTIYYSLSFLLKCNWCYLFHKIIVKITCDNLLWKASCAV